MVRGHLVRSDLRRLIIKAEEIIHRSRSLAPHFILSHWFYNRESKVITMMTFLKCSKTSLLL